jgi:hypothetical protein
MKAVSGYNRLILLPKTANCNRPRLAVFNNRQLKRLAVRGLRGGYNRLV